MIDKYQPKKISISKIKSLLNSPEEIDELVSSLQFWAEQQPYIASYALYEIKNFEDLISIKSLVDYGNLKLNETEIFNLNKILNTLEAKKLITLFEDRAINTYTIDNGYNNFNGYEYKELLEILKDTELHDLTLDKLKALNRLNSFIEYTNVPLNPIALSNLKKYSSIYLDNISKKRQFSLFYANKYGVDQNGLSDLFDTVSKKFGENSEIKDNVFKIVKEYFPTMSKSNMKRYLNSINSVGACSYASPLNNICILFEGKEELFKEIFGYDMYREVNGERYINDEYLLADFYSYVNKNNTDLFSRDQNGKWHYIAQGKNTKQIYVSTYNDGLNTNLLTDFINHKLKTMSASKKYEINISKGKRIKLDFNYYEMHRVIWPIKEQIISSLEKNEMIDFGVYANFSDNKNFTMYKYNPDTNKYDSKLSSKYWQDSDLEEGLSQAKDVVGHAMAVTGMDNDGIYVASWGEPYYIPFKEMNLISLDVSSDQLNIQKK